MTKLVVQRAFRYRRNESYGRNGRRIIVDGGANPTARSGMTSYDALHYGRGLGIT